MFTWYHRGRQFVENDTMIQLMMLIGCKCSTCLLFSSLETFWSPGVVSHESTSHVAKLSHVSHEPRLELLVEMVLAKINCSGTKEINWGTGVWECWLDEELFVGNFVLGKYLKQNISVTSWKVWLFNDTFMLMMSPQGWNRFYNSWIQIVRDLFFIYTFMW